MRAKLALAISMLVIFAMGVIGPVRAAAKPGPQVAVRIGDHDRDWRRREWRRREWMRRERIRRWRMEHGYYGNGYYRH